MYDDVLYSSFYHENMFYLLNININMSYNLQNNIYNAKNTCKCS